MTLPFRRILAAVGVLALLVLSPAPASATPFTEEQTRQIEQVVREMLLQNPEILEEMIEALQEKRDGETRARASRALEERGDELFRNPASPVGGNPDGDVTLVEFFDYRCGYCKAVFDPMMEAVEADGNVRLVYKEFPILGPESVYAARAALAARAQDGYIPFHEALMRHRGGYDERVVMALAERSGLDPERLKRDMEDPAIERDLAANHSLARALGITGTPAFVIGDQVVPGAVSREALTDLIEQARRPAGG